MLIRESKSRKIFNVCNIVIMLGISATVLFPYLNIFAKAFNEGKDTARGGITIFPRVFTLDNFQAVLGDANFTRAAVNTVAITVLGTFIGLLVQFVTAYVFMHKHFMGHKVLFILFLIPMYIGGGIIPRYILYSKIGLMNNFLVYILPGCFSTYNMIILRSYMESVPTSLAESAKVDGANHLTIAFRIILPLCKPVLATVGLWLAVAHWNEWQNTLYYVTKKSLYTMQYVLMQVLKEAEKIQQILREAQMRGEMLELQTEITTEAVRSAQLVVTTMPIILVYPFLQKYFIAGVTLGAVKD